MNIFKQCVKLQEAGRNAALITVIEASTGTPGKPGFKMLLADDGEFFGTVGGGGLEHQALEEAKKVLKDGKNRILHYNLDEIGMKCGGKATLVIEYIKAGKAFILFGGGHIGRALAPILESLGFQITIFDSRKEARELIKESLQDKVIIGSYDDLSPVKEKLKSAQFCFIATHGHKYDYTVLKQVLKTKDEYEYIGLIGSKKKVRTTLEQLNSDGLKAPDYLYAPVGIKIGGDSAEEIAVSIASEVIACIYNVPVKHMRLDGIT